MSVGNVDFISVVEEPSLDQLECSLLPEYILVTFPILPSGNTHVNNMPYPRTGSHMGIL